MVARVLVIDKLDQGYPLPSVMLDSGIRPILLESESEISKGQVIYLARSGYPAGIFDSGSVLLNQNVNGCVRM